jgi:hypothetical protein
LATEDGKVLLCKLDQRLRQAEDHVLGALDEADRDTLRGLLQRVALRVNAVDPVHSACEVVQDIADADRSVMVTGQ